MTISSRGKKEVQVTIKLKPMSDIWQYSPGTGINKVVYEKKVFDRTIDHIFRKTQTRIRTQTCAADELNLMLTASSVNPDPMSRKFKEDLDRELTKLNVVSDKLTQNQEPGMLTTDIKHQQHIGFINDPAMEELDSLKKHMQKIRKVTIDQAQFNRIQSYMDTYLPLYQRPSNMQAKADRFLTERKERDPHSHMKMYDGEVAEW